MPHKGLYGKVKGAVKSTAKTATKAIGGKNQPSIKQVVGVAKRANPIRGIVKTGRALRKK